VTSPLTKPGLAGVVAMAKASARHGAAAARHRPRFHGSWRRIGPRLLGGFLLLIVPMVVIGVTSMQRFNALTATTTELSTRDLPEITTMDHLRSLLFQLRDLDLQALSNQSAQTPLLSAIGAQHAALLKLEPPDTLDIRATDTALVTTVIGGITRSNALVARIQALVSAGRRQEARTTQQQQFWPLLDSVLTATGKLRSSEETEAATAAAHVREESGRATQLVLVMLTLSLPVSVVLALLLTRSLTRPLSALLRATAAVASGNLQASPQIQSADEIGQLAGAFDTMRSNLRATIKALAVERQQTQAIIDACADGMILVDGQYRVVQINPAAEQLTGWRTAEAVGRPCWEMCGCCQEPAEECGSPDQLSNIVSAPASRVARPPCLACPRATGVPTHNAGDSREQLVRLPTGQRRWLAVSCAPIPSDEEIAGTRLVVSLHDVTQLKAVDQLKSDFVAMVSHELRAPVTTVSGAVEMLNALDAAEDAGAHREVLDILAQQTQRLRMVVDEVLQVTRLEAGHLPVRLHPLPLAEFMRSLVERVRQGWIDGEPPPISVEGEETLVWADPSMLEIVFRNLLDNARKYAPPGSPIEIIIRRDAGLDRMQVRLYDHGPGIPPEQLEHIFERFSRGPHTAASWTRGYGLGLYIARELLRAHNGEIWAENQPDGACFVCSLCAIAPAEIAEPVESAVPV
jgi:two-component system sensor histidine kinase ResE